MPARRKNVRQQNEIILEFIPRRPRQLQAIEVRKGNPQKLRLAASIRTHARVTVTGRRSLGVRSETRISKPARTVETKTARDVEGKHHPVSAPDGNNTLPDLLDNPLVLMPEHNARLRGTALFVHM